MNEKEKSVLAAVEKAIGNDWHFKNLMPLVRGTFGNVYELAKNNPMIGPDYRPNVKKKAESCQRRT